MDELNKDPFNFDEIDKIQKEIDQDLQYNTASAPVNITDENGLDHSAVNTSFLSSNDTIKVPLEHTGETSFPGVGTRIVPSEPLTEPVYETPGCCPTNDFFKETIKNDADKSGKSKFKRAMALAILVSLVGGISGGLSLSVGNYYLSKKASKNIKVTQEAAEFQFAAAQDLLPISEATVVENSFSPLVSFSHIIDKVEPSVVAISAFQEGFNPKNFFYSPDDYYNSPALGSGIIFDQDETKVYIVTNYHVITNDTTITVSITGSEEVPAKTVGTNPESDLAVISVLKSDLAAVDILEVSVATFGISNNMQVGDFVIAIGNALGEGNTATFGMISATNKEINVSDTILTVVQTDAAINPGNSGGPLININGEIIGINTVKLADNLVEGMGYSITSDVAMPIIEELRNEITKPFLGISGGNITQQIAQAYALPQIGVFVDSVIEGSSADKGGIKPNDIITSFNGQTVYGMEQLSESIRSCEIGDKVEINVLRNGEVKIIKITLQERS